VEVPFSQCAQTRQPGIVRRQEVEVAASRPHVFRVNALDLQAIPINGLNFQSNDGA
jgi:hypothetical protein